MTERPESRAGDSMSPERRAFTRVLSQLPVTVMVNGEELPGQTIDVSLGGLLVRCTEGGAQADDDCAIVIDLDAQQHICIGGRVVRSFGDCLAIEMTAIDTMSAMHLYQLVRHNVDEVDEVEEEVRRWLGVAEAC